MTTRAKLEFVAQMSRLSLASVRDLQALMRYAESWRKAQAARDWRKASKMQAKFTHLCQDYGFTAHFSLERVTISAEGETVEVPTFEGGANGR